jgi:dienelactone hydrolase
MKKLAGSICLFMLCVVGSGPQTATEKNFPGTRNSNGPEFLPGTALLTWNGDLSVRMMDGAHKLIEDKITESIAGRTEYWHRDFSSRQAYEKSVEPNRKSFMHCIGVEDNKELLISYNAGFEDKNPPVLMQRFADNSDSELVAATSKYRVYQVRWPVLNRMNGEGLLIQPKGKPIASIIVLPDADQTPEQLVGLVAGIPPGSQIARHLAENGFQVLVPVLISRTLLFPGKPEQQSFRERIYRQAYHMGRHIIGYEVQKVLSAIDWFKQSSGLDGKIGVVGYCEGGLVAFYAAAVDKRVDAVLVSGYFNSRQGVWDEPIYRNVWGLLKEFGDAEIASLIAPRPLVIEYSRVPEIVDEMLKNDHNPQQEEDLPFTGYKGTIKTPGYDEVLGEYNRIDNLVKPGFQSRHLIKEPGNKPMNFGSREALDEFIKQLGQNPMSGISDEIPQDTRLSFNSGERQFRQAKEMEDHVQWLVRNSDQERNRYFLYEVMPEFGKREWSTKSYHPFYKPVKFVEEAKKYRKVFSEEILGKFEEPMMSPNPRTRKVYDKERWTGYEVVLDVYSDLFAWGILLIPKDIIPGERRPVVVCQHGRGGLPMKLVEGNTSGYNDVASRLADQGFIVYVPHNLYRGEDRYRWLCRKANSVGKTLFSFIVSQHDQTLQWLGTLSFVDKNRIAFYGLSYGGETAMRVPAVLEGYCLSICSGDFGDWTRKVTDTYYAGSFMNSLEWEMPYFNMGATFSYAEMAYLIFPRPFMVERGHDDIVQPDEWVAYEYGKVNYFYDKFGLGDNTSIEFFNGGHAMRCAGTFAFLHKHLNWP